MGTFPSAAATIRPPADPAQQQATLQQLLAGRLENQQRQLQVQQAQQAQADNKALTTAMSQWDAKDVSALPSLVLKNGGSANAVFAATQHIQEMRIKNSEVAKNDAATGASTLETTIKNHDQSRGRVQAIISAPADQKQQLWDAEITQQEQSGKIKPGMMSHTYPGDDQATVFANTYALGSVLAKEAAEKMQAEARQTSANAAVGELTLNQKKFAGSPEELARRAAQGDTEAQGILQQQNDQAVKTAGQKAGAEAAAKFPYELQLKQQELAQNPVFAVNPKTGQRELTTVAEAKTNGFTNPVKVSQSDLEHETTLNAQLNDLQLNTSRYKAALNGMGALSKSDVANMAKVLSDKSINSFLANELTLGVALDQVSQGEKASAWNALSPDKQAALIGALRMKNSALLFQKVSTGMGRASKEAMDIEIANMPSPIEGATVGNQKLTSFQENIDQMASRSVKLPWQERSTDVRSRIEGQAVDQYNQREAAKPQGQYRSKGSVTVGQNIQLPHTPGLSRVKKVYSDGTFDADQKP